jgi:hypothetical protein
MFKHQGRRVFGGLVIAAALVGCGPIEGSAVGELSEDGQLSEVQQGVTIISGYNINLPAGGPYTRTGYVLPRWTAPSNHSTKDWIAMAPVGSPTSSYVAWQYVNSAGLTSGVGEGFTIPGNVDTSVQYEIRYFLNDTATLAAKSAAFSVQTIPTVQCGAGVSGGDLPTVNLVGVNKTAGTVSLNYDAQSVKDRFLVYSGGTLLFDSGCTSGVYTVPLTFSSPASQVRVVTIPSCLGDSGTGWSFSVGCAI